MSRIPWKFIIWDWNGTLLDDVEAGLNSVNLMLNRRNLPPLTRSHYREIFGFPVRAFYQKAGFRLEDEDWDAMAREFHQNFLASDSIRLHDQAQMLLRHFQELGIGQAILSASEQSILDRMLRAFGIAPYFTRICGVDNLYGSSKLDLGRRLLGQIDIPPKDILFIGDTLHDAEVAHQLGTDCLLISAGHQSHERLCSSPFPVLRGLDELMRLHFPA